MTLYIAQSQINSILTAARTDDDMRAILERMNTNDGLQVVSDNDPRAIDLAVNFMYPNGARKAYQQAKPIDRNTQLTYPAHIVMGGDGKCVISFRDVPEAITQGDDLTHGIEMAQDALVTAFEFYDEDQRPMALPSAFEPGELAIRLSVEASQKIIDHNNKLATNAKG